MTDRDEARPGGSPGDATFRPEEWGRGRAAPTWMRALPPPPLSPDAEPVPPRPVRGRWLASIAAGLGFGVMGAVMYAALAILVGQEVQASAVVVGVLVGSGLRLGGRPAGWATGLVAAVIAVAALVVGAVIGAACVDAIAIPAPLGQTLGDAAGDPLASAGDYLTGAPLTAGIAVALAACGALLATLTFRPPER
ncbi:hypothetical protein [Demequina sp. NBRC 110057]|uniref:hypothetical protein n=1 Tax=Demequina sp. NBRC 110057 TaxID=1570346 RepID=UPI001356594C|nr:hypothetical protein [Demequina sp. NBRC 110057]